MEHRHQNQPAECYRADPDQRKETKRCGHATCGKAIMPAPWHEQKDRGGGQQDPAEEAEGNREEHSRRGGDKTAANEKTKREFRVVPGR